jgi:hypothetical protein
MNIPKTPPDHVISEAELDALERELGLVGMIRYLQQISPGKGDYTAERHKLLAGITLQDIMADLDRMRVANAGQPADEQAS